jgi:methyl-accepting chemotaxis protein
MRARSWIDFLPACANIIWKWPDPLRWRKKPVLALDSRIKICGAFDRNGYLPTNHPHYSHPQTDDVIWNEANCRNRRIFDDRTTVAAVAHPGPFLVQTYRRQMGNGSSVVMKEASSPVKVNGRHWGAVRLAYLP